MSFANKRLLYVVARETARDLRNETTPAEKRFWHAIRRRQCGGWKFLRQYPILYDLLGRETYLVADFCCVELKLVIEIDGPIHDTRKERDKERDAVLALLGYRVLHFTNEEIEDDLGKALQRVLDTIGEIEAQNQA